MTTDPSSPLTSQPASSDPPPAAGGRRRIRRILRGVFYLLTLALGLALVLALAAWHKSRTPLDIHPPVWDAPAVAGADEAHSARLHFPDDDWRPVDPASAGWSPSALDEAHAYARSLDTSSLMIVHRGLPVAVWGDVDRRENSQSMRKSLLSSLFGFVVAEGSLSLDTTLADLGLDDDPPLTAAERQATVEHLLLSRSGIYHSALYEVGSWKRGKPERGTHAPDESWYYNNWDFNALATVFRHAAGRPLDQAFAERIAGPVGMQDYRPSDVVYLTRDHWTERMMGNQSDHPAYVFMISARDLARFGLLYLADGRWAGVQVLPPGWARQSTVGAARPTGWGDTSYGYMWWRYLPTEERPYEMLVARGGRGHRLMIFPELELVIVHRIPTGGVGLGAQLFRRFVWHPAVTEPQHDTLLGKIFDAMPTRAPSEPTSETPQASGPSPS